MAARARLGAAGALEMTARAHLGAADGSKWRFDPAGAPLPTSDTLQMSVFQLIGNAAYGHLFFHLF